MTEARYQAALIKRLEHLFPGCLVLKNDSGYLQGIPDLSIFFGKNWAMLEVKADPDSPFQPNQEYYLTWAGEMSFAAVICPQNEEDVLRGLQLAFSA